MGWQDLLQTGDETLVSPWVEGRSLRQGDRTWTIDGKLPKEQGWYEFKLANRRAKLKGATENPGGALKFIKRGYLVGDRFVEDTVRVDPDPAKIIAFSEPLFLVEPGLDRFVRVAAGRMCEDGPLVYEGQEMPLGSEEEVLKVFLDSGNSVDGIPGVVPALDAAFRMEALQRVEAQRRRAELERQRLLKEERLKLEERRKKLFEKLGDAAGRREMALHDFAEAARAALAVGGAKYLDHRKAVRKNEMAVRYSINGRNYECTCDAYTLRIIDAGICLINHGTGEKGDTYFTLESLPGVVLQAMGERRLVVFRHVDGVVRPEFRADPDRFHDDDDNFDD
jgi:hypothetical protein